MVHVAVAIARTVPAFDAPGDERRMARRLIKTLSNSYIPTLSVSVQDGELYAFLSFLSSDRGRQRSPENYQKLIEYLAKSLGSDAKLECSGPRNCARVGVFDLYVPASTSKPDALVLALLSLRPSPLLPLNMGSARRAVTFVHGYIALVTANAYISTLGGGHFLCLHLAQAKLMARLQIAISDALHDPVLKSKCRVNLAYNAMREGRFRRAHRLITQEETVAKHLANDELEKICAAAQVYLAKTIRLHREFQRKRSELTVKDRVLVDNFYRQRIVRKAK